MIKQYTIEQIKIFNSGSMFYRKDIEKVIKRHMSFHSAESNGHILVQINLFNENTTWPDMGKYNLPTQWKPFMDEWIKFSDRWFKYHEEIDDDIIPTVLLNLGVGHLGAFVGGKVIFSDGTSWSTPIIKDWDDMDNIKLDEENYWFRLSNEIIKYLLDKVGGRLGVAALTFYNPSDLAYALRGDILFNDLYEHPGEVHRLMNFCSDAIIWFAETQKEIVGQFRDGTLVSWGGGLWLPGRTIGMSADIANLCSRETYNEFFKRYDQKIINHFGGGWIHTHSIGLHLIEEIASLRNLHVLEIAEDPKQPRPIDVLEDLIQKAKGVPLQINCNSEELRDKIDIITKGNVILDISCRDIQEAKETVSFVRKCSRC